MYWPAKLNAGTDLESIHIHEGKYLPAELIPKNFSAQWADILYPKELYWVYHAMHHRTLSAVLHGINEEFCDKLLIDFLSKQNPEKYLQTLRKAISVEMRRVIYARIACAAFGQGSRKADNLANPQMFAKAKEMLEINYDLDYNRAYTILEQENRALDFEGQILARVAYLAIWYNCSGKQLSHAEALKQLCPPKDDIQIIQETLPGWRI